jgi:hypothetical protein
MFLTDLSDALGAHVGIYTIYNLVSPLCESAMRDKSLSKKPGSNTKEWDLEKFLKKFRDRFVTHYDCTPEQVPALFQHFVIAITAKFPLYQQN